MTARQTYNSIRKQFKSNRLKQRVSLRDAAKEIGIHHCCLHRFEHGSMIDAVNFIKLQQFVGEL